PAVALPKSSCWNAGMTRGFRLRLATFRWKPWRAPTHGCWSRAAVKAMLREHRLVPICCANDDAMNQSPTTKKTDSVDQDQFLTILSREDALARFEEALFPRALPSEMRQLTDALGCALNEDVTAPLDVPPFDRSNVDGFAVRSADLASASEAAPVRLRLNDEVIACGVTPA